MMGIIMNGIDGNILIYNKICSIYTLKVISFPNFNNAELSHSTFTCWNMPFTILYSWNVIDILVGLGMLRLFLPMNVGYNHKSQAYIMKIS